MRKILPVITVVILVVSGLIVSPIAEMRTESDNIVVCDEIEFQTCVKSALFNESELIDEYTWSVMRYDHVIESDNFGFVSMPKPSPGPVIIPVNMMSLDVCHAAISLYHENKTEILEALEEFDFDSMVVGLPYIFWAMFASQNSFPIYSQKATAKEMNLFGDKIFWANYVGDCYAQSLFNTAVLRLCGFSPEEVFTLLMPMHAVSIVKLGDEWVVFDNVMGQFSKNSISNSYNPPAEDIIYWLENDKYFINFGTPSPEAWPYQENPYSNLDSELLIDMVEHIIPLFNNATLGAKGWNVYSFLENVTPCVDMVSLGIPFDVDDAEGTTIEEKAQSLMNLNIDFVTNQTGNEIPNQYDRSLYSLGWLSVTYPQAYVNAAKYGSWTSWFAALFDSRKPDVDIKRTVNWVNFFIRDKEISDDNYVYFSDFSYRIKRGSKVDKAIVAYGTLRNMKKNDDFWQPKDLYVLVTDDYEGYLAVNVTDGWYYLNFGVGESIVSDPPDELRISFNELESLHTWKE